MLLDTNVVSVLIKPDIPAGVLRWFDTQDTAALWTTSITVFEVWSGLWRMPEGARRRRLELSAERLLGTILQGRTAEVDYAAARLAARVAADRTSRGRSVDAADTLIAGIALSRGATVATRNLRHFADVPGLAVVDPFEA